MTQRGKTEKSKGKLEDMEVEIRGCTIYLVGTAETENRKKRGANM